jgi:glycosyltransferase involved in cell wall biosynthesis
MNNQPFFSIVMPTRNRANLLPFAIKSVLNQDFKDFEIIVSDNCSNDNTKEIIETFKDNRIKYYRSEVFLPISDNWANGLSKINGKYITFLPDDDAFSINLLSNAKIAIDKTQTELLSWEFCYYYANEWFDKNYPIGHSLRKTKKNTIVVAPFNGRLVKIDTKKSIEQMLLSHNGNLILENPKKAVRPPQLSNAFYSKQLLNRIEDRNIQFFRGVASDIYSLIIAMSLTKSHHFLDLPLSIYCINEVSTTSQMPKKGEKSMQNYFQQNTQENTTEFVPIKIISKQNLFLESILQAHYSLGEDVSQLKVNWSNYYVQFYNNLLSAKTNGADIKDELDAFEKAISLESVSLQKDVLKKIKGIKPNIIRLLRKFPQTNLSRKIMKNIRTLSLVNDRIYIDGNKLGIDNIQKCGEWMNQETLNNLVL